MNLTVGYRAECGVLGGVLNDLTRSRSNDLHAHAFRYRSDLADRLLLPPNETDNRVSLPARVSGCLSL